MYDSIDIKDISRINVSNPIYKNVLLDIRDKYEYMLGHIAKAINIPYTYLITMPNNYLKLDETYYVYCENGIKSRKICEFLNDLGYKCVDLIGGYRAYIDDR